MNKVLVHTRPKGSLTQACARLCPYAALKGLLINMSDKPSTICRRLEDYRGRDIGTQMKLAAA